MEFEKRFDINSNRKLIYQKDSRTYSLREVIFGDGKIVKHGIKVDENIINPGKDGCIKTLKRLINRLSK